MLAALLWWGGAEAQDVILLRNADEVKAEVREITDSHILYTLWGGSDKVLSLPRAEVFSVTYQNGEKELFVGDDSGATGPVTAADYLWPRVTKSYRPGDLFDEDGIRGIVISTTDNGRHGLILSLEQAPKSLRWSADSSWATDLLLGQLCGKAEGFEKFGNKESYRFSRRISELSESYGGDKLSVWTDSRFWWSSTERKDNVAQIVDFGMPLQTRLVNVYAYRSDRNHVRTKTWQQFVEAGWEKTGKWPVRAVHKF